MSFKIEKALSFQPSAFRVIILFILFTIHHSLSTISYAAPCYGTRMPKKNSIDMGLENYTISKRYLGDNRGKVRSGQNFLELSYGIFDWLSLDLKGGEGDIIQSPPDSDVVSYPSGFAGGYGFRLKFWDKKSTKMVFGFQHISVHPRHKAIGDIKNQAILDDWQVSLLGSYDFTYLTPYLGTRWSRVDYIHKANDTRKRRMSDRTKSIGLIFGMDIPVGKKFWLNLEGQFLDADAFTFSTNYSF